MKPILLLYATREGHTRRIAQYLGARLEAHGCSFDAVDAAHVPEAFSLDKYAAVIAGASLHLGRYEPEMVRFVKHHLKELQPMTTVFVSVSLAHTPADDPHAPPEKRAAAEAQVQKTIDHFVSETGWREFTDWKTLDHLADDLLYGSV